jgi:hypothetical protein
MGQVRSGAGAVTGTVQVDTNVFTARLREHSPLATRYAKHLFGQRIALAPQTSLVGMGDQGPGRSIASNAVAVRKGAQFHPKAEASAGSG